jgi:membrane protein DedA with SNARE-associated domain
MEIFKDLATYIVHLIGSTGYLGIFILMILESTALPIILPAELVLFSAGYYIHEGNMLLIPLVLVATVGSLLGSFINYYAALFLGRRLMYRYGKYIFLNRTKLQQLEIAFIKHSSIITFTARFLPLVKHIASIPAGFCKMSKKKFATWTSAGSAIFCSIVISIGYYVGGNKARFDEIKHHMIFGILAFVTIIFIGYYFYNKYLIEDGNK